MHLNFPLREPLVAPVELPPGRGGRADGAPWLARRRARGQAEDLSAWVAAHPHGVVVAGRAERGQPELAEALARFAAAAGWPLLADPLSWARRGPAAVAHYDALLRSQSFPATAVVRVGDLPTSKPLRAWLTSLGGEQVAFEPEGVWHDPDATLASVLAADPVATLAADVSVGDPAWLERWTAADAAAARAIDETLGDALGEPRVARELTALLPHDATLFVASSMPVRDVETPMASTGRCRRRSAPRLRATGRWRC